MVDWEGLYARGRRQHGVLALYQGERYGLSEGALLRYAQRHGWDRPFTNVVLLPGAHATFETAAAAAVLQAGGRVLLARSSAAYLWGMTRSAPPRVELAIPADRKVQMLPGVSMWRSRTLTMMDAEARGPLPVTRPARTIVDLAAVTPIDPLRSLVIDARQRRVLALADLDAAVRRLTHATGRGKVTRILRDLDEEVCDSILEHRWRRTLRAVGLRPWPRPFPFRCSDGVAIEIDVAFPVEWVSCECDGLSSRAERASLTKHHRRQTPPFPTVNVCRA